MVNSAKSMRSKAFWGFRKESMLHGCVNTLIELLSDSDTALESAIS
jgi:hypothetical protein